MDPLSLTASLLAVIAAAQGGIAGLRKLSNYRKAPSEIEELTSELDRLHAVLNEVRSFAQLKDDLLMFSEGKASPFDVNINGSNALTYAACHSGPLTCRYLLQQGVDPDVANWFGKTPAEMFWERGWGEHYGPESMNSVKSMLKDNDYIQTRNFNLIHKIILSIVDKDLTSELGFSTAIINEVDSEGKTPLCLAAIRDDVSAVETLLSFGAKPNIKDTLGQTPLHFVKSTEVCNLLLKAGVERDARNSYLGRSALHHLCHGVKDLDVLDILVEAGMDINIRDAAGESPLMIAKRFATGKRLIELGADVDLVEYSSGLSVILAAVKFDHHEILPLLLQNGANYTTLNRYGGNIAHVAAQFSSAEVMSFLAEANLVNLDMDLKDVTGKTPADLLAERRVLAVDEADLCEAFERLMRSIPAQQRDHGHQPSGALSGKCKTLDEYRLPGAYPKDIS
ncbi:hypothetical protein P7C71_g3424, partial [Lecanoromycetidae sp. Uapishka_2]